MKRQDLKNKMQELGLEVNDDLINYVMAQNGADIETLKTNHANELQSLETQLSEAKQQLTQAETNASKYSDYDELKKFKEDALLKVENEQKLEYLKAVKCKHPELFVDKFDWTKATYNQEKKTYEGLEEQIKTYQEQYSSMFEIEKQQVIIPEGGSNTNLNLTGVEKAFYQLNPDLKK
jgi:hypothetical protein